MLAASPEGTLIPSILLPAHFMPRSALIDVKIVPQILEYQCECVCLFSCSTHLLICVRVCVIFVCVWVWLIVFVVFFFFSYLKCFILPSSVEPPVWTTSERECSRDTSHRWKEWRVFYVHGTFKLYELVIVLWLSFGRLIQNKKKSIRTHVCLHVCERDLQTEVEILFFPTKDYCWLKVKYDTHNVN